MRFCVEEQVKPKKWIRHPLDFMDVEMAEHYAELVFKESKHSTRVVDERYRDGRKKGK